MSEAADILRKAKELSPDYDSIADAIDAAYLTTEYAEREDSHLLLICIRLARSALTKLQEVEPGFSATSPANHIAIFDRAIALAEAGNNA